MIQNSNKLRREIRVTRFKVTRCLTSNQFIFLPKYLHAPVGRPKKDRTNYVNIGVD